MANRDPRMVQLERVVRGFGRGIYTALEVAGYCVAIADEVPAPALLRLLAPPILQEVKRWVHAAPTATEDWERVKLVDIGIVREPELNQTERVAKYRAAIEALRSAL